MPSDTIQSARRVIAQHPAKRDDIGDLVTRRPLPGPQLEQLDPFLFLNHHGPQTYPANKIPIFRKNETPEAITSPNSNGNP